MGDGWLTRGTKSERGYEGERAVQIMVSMRTLQTVVKSIETKVPTSKLFCMAPAPNHPKSPPFLALEQSLSSAAIRANSLGRSCCGTDWRWSMICWMRWRASASGRVMLG